MDMKINSDRIKSLNRIKPKNTDENHSSVPEILWLRTVKYKPGRNITLRRHHHDFFELHFVLGGSTVYTVENTEITMCAGQYLMIKPMVKHSLSSISTDFLKLTAAFIVTEGNPLADALNSDKFVCSNLTPYLESSVEFLFEETSRPTEYTAQIITGRVCEMLYSIVKHKLHTVETNISDTSADERMIRAKKYIADNVSNFLDSGEVADYCNLSIKQLNRLFTANEGMTILRYIHLFKIARAKELLLAGELSIREISTALGFQNEYYFNTFFTRVAGMTPGDFRRSNNVPK